MIITASQWKTSNSMPHVVEVDQSIKIEQSGDTVLAFADGISHAILIPSHVKTEGLRALVRRGKPRETAYLLLFCACLYLLLKDHLDLVESITIDQEYWGQEAHIRSFLLEYIKRDGLFFESDRIHFGRVGRGSPSDRKARAVREGKDTNYREICVEEMLVVVA